MSAAERAAKSRYLKRKVQSELHTLDKDQKIARIIQGPLHFATNVPSSECERVDDTIEYSDSSLELCLPSSNSLNLVDDSIKVSETSVELNSNNINYGSFSEESDDSISDQYFFSSDSELSCDENIALPKQNATCEEDPDLGLNKKLTDWALKFNIKHNALSQLLKILKEENHPNLPLDSRTLLKTARKSEVIVNNDGSNNCYFGIEKGLLQYNLDKICKNSNAVLKFNIDGLPICKSTGGQFWPILCQIVSKYTVSPFVVSCYHGNSKPKSVHEFLEPFIKELKTLQTCGFQYHDICYSVLIENFICDAPARAFIKCIKGHGGFFGCEKCVQKGSSVNRRVVFLETQAKVRTDESFKLKIQEKHHLGTSPLLNLNIGLVTQVPLDYMHLVLLGCMRKLLLYWIRKGDHNVRLGYTHQVSHISEKLLSLAKHMPKEFSRKPRSLKDIDRFKATEFRQILLYTGPIVFRGILSEEIYNHFLLLHVAISTLANEDKSHSENNISYAEKLLKLFVQEMKDIYKEESIVYNIHNLVHLPDDVRRFGCLDKFSCFPFENFLFQLKNMLRTPNKPLSQLARRISEKGIGKDERQIPLVKLSGPHNRGPCASIKGRQFEEIIYNGSTINILKENNSFVQLHNKKIVKILNIINTQHPTEDPHTIVIICKEYINCGDYYTYPCSSQQQSIYKINDKKCKDFQYSLDQVKCKCLVSTELKVAVALVHNIF